MSKLQILKIPVELKIVSIIDLILNGKKTSTDNKGDDLKHFKTRCGSLKQYSLIRYISIVQVGPLNKSGTVSCLL